MGGASKTDPNAKKAIYEYTKREINMRQVVFGSGQSIFSTLVMYNLFVCYFFHYKQ